MPFAHGVIGKNPPPRRAERDNRLDSGTTLHLAVFAFETPWWRDTCKARSGSCVAQTGLNAKAEGASACRNKAAAPLEDLTMRSLLRFVAVLWVVGTSCASADVSLSTSSDPTGGIGAVMATEHVAMSSVPTGRLRAISQGEVEAADGAGAFYSRAWLEARPEPAGGPEWECLATAIYFEARGETLQGQAAVAEVILNRVESPDFPDTVCGVVNEGSDRRHACQFSFSCDGKPDRPRDALAFKLAGRIADYLLQGGARTLTHGATHFHARRVEPGWARADSATTRIGRHVFFRL
jgi:hypothetical protein